MRPALGASLLLLARSSGGGSLPNPPGPTLRQLAAARTPPLLIGSDLVDVCPFPCTGAPARTCQAGAMAPNASYASIAADQFNFGNWDWTISWTVTQPTPADTFDFTLSDRLIPFMKAANMSARVNGIMNAHNLLPNTTCPPLWLINGYKNGTYGRAQLKGFLQRRIEAVVPHWIKAGVPILGLFAVNEAIFNQQNDALGEWPHNWLVGPELNLFSFAFDNGTDWFGQTFKWVAAAAEKAVAGTSLPRPRIFYNDYGIETICPKSDATLRWLTEQKAAGVPIDGIGFQAHMNCKTVLASNGTAAVLANFRRFVDAGFHVWVTEMDVQMLPGCTEEDQAAVYSAVLGACLALKEHCDAFMVWGFSDRYTWLPTKAPNLYTADYRAKPAYYALREVLQQAP